MREAALHQVLVRPVPLVLDITAGGGVVHFEDHRSIKFSGGSGTARDDPRLVGVWASRRNGCRSVRFTGVFDGESFDIKLLFNVLMLRHEMTRREVRVVVRGISRSCRHGNWPGHFGWFCPAEHDSRDQYDEAWNNEK